MPYYAVRNGRNIGIFTVWKDCSESVNGFPNAKYKKFDTKQEAEMFIQDMSSDLETNKQSVKSQQRSITSFFGGTCPTTDTTPVIEEFKPDYYVYTDGACSNNGKPGAMSSIGIFFGIDDPRNVSCKIDGKQTNNTAELTAIIRTYSIIESDILAGKKIAIVSDSEYAIRCASTYGEKNNKKNWNSDIPNKDLVKTVYMLYKNTPNVQFIHINSHTTNTDIHSVGNAHADHLATLALE